MDSFENNLGESEKQNGVLKINNTGRLFIPLILVSLTLIGIASATIDTQNCTPCHPGLNFQVPDVNLANCTICHSGLPGGTKYHYLNLYLTDYGYFRVGTDPTWYSNPLNNSSIHMTAHPGSSTYNGGGVGWCGDRCHLTADCVTCHDGVPHVSHGNLTLPLLSVGNGTWPPTYANPALYTKLVTCANSSCHQPLSKTQNIVVQPSCTNCHDASPHGDLNQTHNSTTDMTSCIKPGCHNSSFLTTEHESKGLNCSSCHSSQNATVKNAISTHNTACNACHITAHGGPDCVACHDIGSGAPKHVDVAAMNQFDSVHKDLNNIGSSYPESERCWACHGDGTQPLVAAHPPEYKSPKECDDCHRNLNSATNFSAWQVSEHIISGSQIHTPQAVNCTDCHNKNEMLKFNLDPDTGSAIAVVSHYGKKRPELIIDDTYTNCSYCHQNTSTAFSAQMIDPSWNASIEKHASSAANPTCVNSSCHQNGRIHNDTLQVPAFTTDLCWKCHSSFIKHNGTVECERCHAASSRNIHPIQFIQPDGNFKNFSDFQARQNAANCSDCHITGVPDFPTASMIPYPFHHSDDLSNGTVWDSYWNAGVDVDTACVYCHDYVLHNATPLGRPLLWNSKYVINDSITSSGSYCSDCHYKGDSNYTTMKASFTVDSLQVPPEITNGTWKSYPVWDGTSGYLNHSMPVSSFNDVTCRSCHSGGKSPAYLTSLMHEVYRVGDVKETHNSTTDMTSCIKSGCHFSRYLTTEHKERGLDCFDCHGSTNSTIQSAISSGDTNCTVCHAGHGAINQTKCAACHGSKQGTTGSSVATPDTQVAGASKLLVATDRYIVLDDPIISGGKSGPGFGLPADDWGASNNRWTGKQTIIGVKALYINSNGFPIVGQTVNFTIYYPNNTLMKTGSSVTDSSGLASFYENTDNSKYYGVWNVKAESQGRSNNTSFIYNWWGCAYASGGCANEHRDKSPGAKGTAVANSPYTMSWEKITAEEGAHRAKYCTACHSSYDGQPAYNNTTSNRDSYPVDVHRNISCSNASCHDPGTDYSKHNAGTITIGSCSNCHFRTDISDKTTVDSSGVSRYSNSSSRAYDSYHTPNSTVPCVVCHGPMHNITKPDESLKLQRNSETESSQCTVCHSSYGKHNEGVNCTLCHSDDVHAIQVFAQNATYITLNRNNPNPARGNCTTCHQNSTFVTVLRSQTKAGSFSGTTPQISKPMYHSNDPSAGSKWASYWINGTSSSAQLTSCIYCHGETLHNTSALGRPAKFQGDNIVDTTVSSSGSWCSACHYAGYAMYNTMVSIFKGASQLVPPEIAGNNTYAPTSDEGYYNHSPFGMDDASCMKCHYNGTATATTQLMHNVSASDSSKDNIHNVHAGYTCSYCHGDSAAPPPPPPKPAIISWGNNLTNDASLSFTVQRSNAVEFNASSNQIISNWYWTNAIIVSGNGSSASSASRIFNSLGSFQVSVYGVNPNGTASTVTWNVNVVDTTPPGQVQGLKNDTPAQTTVNLSWKANTEGDLWGYQVFKDDVHLAYTQNPYFNVTGLSADTLYQFKVRANDTFNNWGENSTTVTVRTASPPVGITVTVPNGGESWRAGNRYTVRWTYTGSPGSSVKIELLKGGSVNRVITSSTSIGSGGSGTYSWSISDSQTSGSDYKIRVTSTSNSTYTDTSDNNFTITPH